MSSGVSDGSAGATITGVALVVAFAATAGVAGATPATTHLAATNCFHVMPAGVVLFAFIAFHEAEQSFMKLPEAVVAGAVGATAAVVAFAAGAAAVAGTTHLAATNCFHVIPAGVVLLAFIAFQAVEQSFIKLPEAVVAGAAGAVTAGVVTFAGFTAGAAAGGVVVVAAAASVPHWALRKSFHFRPASVPAALAALNFALHSVIDKAEAEALIISGATPTIKAMARLTFRKVLDVVFSCVAPQSVCGHG